MSESENPWGKLGDFSIENCEKSLLKYLYDVPQTFREIRELMPWMDEIGIKCALKNLKKKGLATNLSSRKGGPGWVRIRTDEPAGAGGG